ncbi:uncharacterized protein METZ01_LOCUS129803, partial [marine metagenome]
MAVYCKFNDGSESQTHSHLVSNFQYIIIHKG